MTTVKNDPQRMTDLEKKYQAGADEIDANLAEYEKLVADDKEKMAAFTEAKDQWQKLKQNLNKSSQLSQAGKQEEGLAVYAGDGAKLAAALGNTDLIKQAYNTSEFGSEGSAEKELSNYQKSIEYHIGQMKASFQELSTTAVSSDVFKGFIDGTTTAINVLTKFISVANGVPAVLTAIGAVKAFKNLD